MLSAFRSRLLNTAKGLRSGLRAAKRINPKVYRGDLSIALGAGGVITAGIATYFVTQYLSTPDYAEIRKEIEAVLDDFEYDDGSYGPVLVRLAWHNAGTYSTFDKTGGSCGAGMRFPPEANDGANAGLDVARDLLEPIKQKHPEISYSDLWSLAGTVAIEAMGGPKSEWRGGRKDISDESKCPAQGRLPDAARGADHLRAVFYRMGFSDQEIVALSGGHVFGRCHPDRSGFKGPWVRSPTTFSNDYFRELFETKWTVKKWDGPLQYENPGGDLMMLPTDIALTTDPIFKKYAEAYYKDEALFFKDFAKAWSKLQHLGV